MSEAFAAAWTTPGLLPLILAAVAAGLTYGFAGFGSALIFVPVAAIFLPVPQAAAQMALIGVSSVFTVLPRAWAIADRRRTLTLLLPALIGLIAGVFFLTMLERAVMRWFLVVVGALTLAAIVAGWRISMVPRPRVLVPVGGAAGLLGGATGLLGPVIILFNLAGPDRAELVRANTLSFLTLLALCYVPVLALSGLIAGSTIWLAAILAPFYMIGTRLGQAVFDPARERMYRLIAYVVIALAVLAAVPLWS